jgi:hypothetical protein
MSKSQSRRHAEGPRVTRKGRDVLNAFVKVRSTADGEGASGTSLVLAKPKSHKSRRNWTYKSLGHGIRRVEIAWRDFLEFPCYSDYHWGFDPDVFIWRGQTRSSWSLLPTLDRILNKRSRAAYAYQRHHLEQFQHATRGRRGRSPRQIDSENEWWALGQHHGLRTPLLDWSESPFVAAYFAYLEPAPNQSEPRGIFALDVQSVALRSARILERKERRRGRPPIIEMVRPLTDENPRLVSQSGLFTRGPDGVDIESWVRQNFSKREIQHVLVKFVLPNADRKDAMACLKQMNINHLSLFPDLTGASQYCNLQLDNHRDATLGWG